MTVDTLFPVVGIGCSAGGLEALEELLAHVPESSGMAFVIVQHLDPVHTSALPELLQRVTSMTVVEAVDGVVVRPDHVYVIRPNYDLSILHGKLHLLEQMTPRGLRLPIDFFLRTLAEDLKERAIGVILSGMGSDGVFGLRSIKDRGGLTLVQEPSTAQSDSMPRSAIQAGVADVIAPAKAIPARIMEFLRHPLRGANKDSKPPLSLLNTLDKIVVLLRDRCRTDFSLYKPNTLQRRIERRMVVHQIVNPEDYVRLLRANPHELDLLFKELLIGVTNFFRDPEAWDCLRNEGIPSLLAERPSGGSLRAWVTACSTGEEAYSLAMTFIEAIEQIKPSHRFSLQIYATDLDPDAIERARKGVFPANIAADVSSSRLTRFFTAEDGGYRISRQVREMVVFATHDIISDPPFTKLDILCCRNLLIYFGAELQKRLLQTFHYSLNSGGLLLLGNAETIGNHDHLFKQLNSKLRLFRRLDESRSPGVLNFPTYVAPSNTLINEPLMDSGTDDIGQLTDQLIQQTFAPAAVLVSSSGDIIYISGRTGKYLEPPAGKTNINIHAMARDGLREALTGVILRALKDPQPIVLKGLKVGTNGGAQTVDVTVQAIQKPVQLRGRVIIVFQDVPTAPVRRRQGKAIEAKADDAVHQELQQTREALQLTQEEMQTTVEELKSSNEELQSTNEELTTSKEELQSLNEELQTVNAELQSKVEDLTWIRNDMTNLLNSTEIATIFLDNDMLLRRFSSHATKIFKLISGDVGRPLSHIVTDLDYPGLRDDAMEVLRTLMFCEKEIETHDGRWYRARIMPYRTQDNVINGVVITFIDISETKKLEASLRERGNP
ncbi:chemotaxis protein CheB [Parazoarcus communis]|uniref:Chemotaxis protein CheB n=1 Tax=Parazoarcus communis TaxID=41977 RepID=A0A2U8H6D5_9RHOO|nr:chemotaxis protein CheB [Parazoarcus communis]AWI81120.1 chemotaxis protein CheB [Parazoarcus communis]